MVKIKTIELLHMSGWSLSDDSWSWSAELERREDGHVLLVLAPSVFAGEEIATPDPIAIEGGSDLFDRLKSAWYEHAGEEISEETWQEVAGKVSKFDKALGAGLREQLREWYDPEPVPPTEVELWARQAKWEQGTWGGAGGLNAAFNNGLRSRAVRHFAEKHQKETGALPTGTHLVRVTVGAKGTGADIEPPMGNDPRTLIFVAVFPGGRRPEPDEQTDGAPIVRGSLIEELPGRIARLEAKHGPADPYVKDLKEQLRAMKANDGKTAREVYRLQGAGPVSPRSKRPTQPRSKPDGTNDDTKS